MREQDGYVGNTPGHEAVQRARDAAARGDWDEAFDLFMKADAGGLVSTAELPVLAEVAYAAGHLDGVDLMQCNSHNREKVWLVR